MPKDLPFSAAAERNRVVVLDTLTTLLPPAATVLEIASGTGQHAAHCAAAHPGWTWWPSDGDARALAGIADRCAAFPNVHAPMLLDVTQPWPASRARFDAVFCANLLHISPWATCHGLMQGASRHLADNGTLVVYGPFVVDGEVTAPSNVAFDSDLRARDPGWGLRELADVTTVAAAAGLALTQRVNVPANNLVLVFRAR